MLFDRQFHKNCTNSIFFKWWTFFLFNLLYFFVFAVIVLVVLEKGTLHNLLLVLLFII